MKVCKVEGCEKNTIQLSKLCGMHRERYRKYKSYELPEKMTVKCAVETCTKNASTTIYCNAHYLRLKRNGTLDKVVRNVMREAICSKCGEMILNVTRYQRWKLKNTGLIYHTDGCGWNSELKKHVTVERMINKNPSFNQEIKDKVSKTLKEMHHKPPIQGGNGKGPSLAQKLLFDSIGFPWKLEFVVKTKLKPKDGYPHHYKIDIANENKMIAIEVDGLTHNSDKQREKDLKKTNLLESLGWKVFRFKNEEILNDLSMVLKEIHEAT